MGNDNVRHFKQKLLHKKTQRCPFAHRMGLPLCEKSYTESNCVFLPYLCNFMQKHENCNLAHVKEEMEKKGLVTVGMIGDAGLIHQFSTSLWLQTCSLVEQVFLFPVTLMGKGYIVLLWYKIFKFVVNLQSYSSFG